MRAWWSFLLQPGWRDAAARSACHCSISSASQATVRGPIWMGAGSRPCLTQRRSVERWTDSCAVSARSRIYRRGTDKVCMVVCSFKTITFGGSFATIRIGHPDS